MGLKSGASGALPSFGVWQANQLLARDLLFGAFLLLTFCLYLFKTAPAACSIGPEPSAAAAGSSTAGLAVQQHWTPVWRFFCRKPFESPFSSWSLQQVTAPCQHPATDACQAAGAAVAARIAHDQLEGKQQQLQADISSWTGAVGWCLLALGVLKSIVRGVVARVLVKCTSILLSGLQALFVYFACGWLTGDPFHMLIPPLRLGLLLVLSSPLPLPNLPLLSQMMAKWPARHATRQRLAGAVVGASSSKAAASSSSSSSTGAANSSSSSSSASWVVWYRPAMYWQQPRLRLAMILAQRVLPLLTAAASVGFIPVRFFELASLRYWPMVGQYVYLGWTAFMLVLPFKLHLASSLLEWLLIYSTAVRVNVVYHGIPAASTTSLQHLLASVLCVVVLPAAGVLWLEQGQRTRYRQMQQRLAAAVDGEQEDEEPDLKKASKQQQHAMQSTDACTTVMDDSSSSVCSSAKLRHSVLTKRSGSSDKPLHSSSSSTTYASSPPDFSGPVCSTASKQQLSAADVDVPVSDAASPSPAGDSRITLARASSSTPQRRNSSSSKPRSSKKQREPVASHVSRQLMADIAASLQLAAAAASPLSPAHGKQTSPVAPHNVTATAATDALVAARQPAAAASKHIVPGTATAAATGYCMPTVPEVAGSSGRSSSMDFLACLEEPAVTRQLPAALTAPAAAAAAAACQGLLNSSMVCAPLLCDMQPGLQALLGQEAAAAVLAAAEAAAGTASGPKPGDMPHYTSLAATMPVSIKVHTEHSNVGLLSPLLSSTLAGQLAPYSSAAAPLQLQTACFPGCVQLLGNIFKLMPGFGTGSWADGSHSDNDPSRARNSWAIGQAHSLAPSLLEGVTNGLAAACAPGAASYMPGMGDDLPAVDVVVGSTTATTTEPAATATGVVAGPTPVAAGSVSLQWCDMACLAAGQQQQLTLHLQLAGPQGAAAAAAGGKCRLLAFNGAGVLLDEQAELQQTLRVSLPAQAAGLCHIALLAGPKPDTTADSDKSREPGNAAPAAAAPLLLLPLLVLPEEAAAEMQQAWQAAALAAGQSAAAAAAVSDRAAGSRVSAAIAAAWAGAVSSLAVDITYVLTACSTAAAGCILAVKSAPFCSNSTAAAADQASPLPAGVSAVLRNLLQHLAAQGMFHTMQFLVQTATSATTGTATGVNNSIASSNRSSSSYFEVEPLLEQQPVASCPAAAAAAALLQKPGDFQIKRDHTDVHDSCSSSVLAEAAATEACKPSTDARITLLQLLCGFADPLLESHFLATTFRSSATLDLFSAVYNVAMGVGCWFAAGGKLHALTSPQQQPAGSDSAVRYQAAAAAARLGGWSVRLVWSVVVVGLLHVGTSLGIAVLRVRTYLKLRRKQQQQQQQAADGIGCCSGSERDLTAGDTAECAALAAAAECGAAGFARQRLLAQCIVQVSLLNVLCATGGVIAPLMIVRAWGLHSWAQDASMTLVLGVKAWMYQVPFHWFVPLMAVEVASHAYGSYVFDLQPRYWILVRYATGLLIALAVGGLHNVLGRRQFCGSEQRLKAKAC